MSEQTQLDRIEALVVKLWSRVDKLERRASLMGFVGGIATTLLTKLAGCQ